MFERVNQLAERMATRVSRRRFLSRAAKWAGATAFGLAAFLTPKRAFAGGKTCCSYYFGRSQSLYCIGPGRSCPTTLTVNGLTGTLNGQWAVARCEQCQNILLT